jgi:hypothetical protein
MLVYWVNQHLLISLFNCANVFGMRKFTANFAVTINGAAPKVQALNGQTANHGAITTTGDDRYKTSPYGTAPDYPHGIDKMESMRSPRKEPPPDFSLSHPSAKILPPTYNLYSIGIYP